MKKVSRYRSDELAPEQARQIASLINSVWPAPGKSLDEMSRALIGMEEVKCFYVVWDSGQAIATAQTFPRFIQYGEGELEVLALACVCVHEKFRGSGYGQQIVSEVFRTIDEKGGVVLFQTGVPEFYRKLGSIAVDNRFWNSASGDPTKSPWWDKHVMIYSKNISWPGGPIDLNGSGY